jgi:exo-beta-1,3-glucanase (GH17 family)
MGTLNPRPLGATIQATFRRHVGPVTALAALAVVVSCGGSSTPQVETPDATEAPSAITRRPVTPQVNGEAIRAGISYGPYREGQSPGGVQPTEEEILEDLQILAPHWNMIRIYSSRGPAEPILRLIREHDIPMRVMLGAWIDRERDPETGEEYPEHIAANEAEVAGAIELANAYPEVVFAVSVGNESQVYWSAHTTRRERLIELIRRTRAAIQQPVTTADDYNFWNREESQAVAAEIDFIVLHAYAMWNRQQLEDAVSWTAETVASIRGHHPDLDVYMGETGWATTVHSTGDAATQIVGAAGEEEQARFYREFTAWAAEADQAYFYFEAFDEPWKGGPDPDEVEKHWGLFNVDRTPKLAMRDAVAAVTAEE